MTAGELRSKRMRLIAATRELLEAELSGAAALASKLGVPPPVSWPPEFYDEGAVKYTLTMLEDPGNHGWSSFYLVSDIGLVGIVGYKGPPDAAGTIELGYSLIPAAQGLGYASEGVHALVDHALTFPAVTRVIAETLPALSPSIRVLERTGFRLIGQGSERGVIRFELTRSDAEAGRRSIGPHVRSLLRMQGHMAWANQQVLAAVEAARAGQDAALELLAHVLGAEHVWLSRIRGVATVMAVWPVLTLEECRAAAAENDLGFRTLLLDATPADLQRNISYRNSAGDEYVSSVEDILLHLFAHGAYHRGQIAQQLRRDGAVAAASDYIAFARGAPAAGRTIGD